MMLAMAVFFAPGILAMNRGNVLRNIALWLAIFLGLALFYQNFGPDSPHPLFQLPDSMSGMHGASPRLGSPFGAKDGGVDSNDGTQGFTPPKE